MIADIARIHRTEDIDVIHLEAYCDESHDERPGRKSKRKGRRHQGVFAMAGFVAATETWRIFESRWREALWSVGIDADVHEFHAHDCQQGKGIFCTDAVKTRRWGLWEKLINVIESIGMKAVCCAADMRAFPELTTEYMAADWKPLMSDPYPFLFTWQVQELAVNGWFTTKFGPQLVDLGVLNKRTCCG